MTTMDKAGDTYLPTNDINDYLVRLPPGDFLVIKAGTIFGTAGYNFQSPKIAAFADQLFEFKHYRRGGSKFYTAKAGREFWFIVPKSEIELVPEKGYSYVPVCVNGLRFMLNVSGGGSSHWSDVVGIRAGTYCSWTKTKLTKLAAVSVLPSYVASPDLLGDGPAPATAGWDWEEKVARVMHTSKLQPGVRVLILPNFDGGTEEDMGTFVVRETSAKQQTCSAAGSSSCGLWRLKYRQISWRRTAEINGWDIPRPASYNVLEEMNGSSAIQNTINV